MSLHDRIKEARKNKGLTQEQLGALIGVAKTTVTGYEKNREPTAAKVGEIADALGVDVNFLFQDEMKELHEYNATPDEFEKIIKKYRALNDHGREVVDFVLESEYQNSLKTAAVCESNIYVLNAAHERTDVEVTEEMKQHDEDIMDDENF